ncbi:MAG: L-threonylcarbamoyladenylate synthase [Candidatus Peribacteraceae bacterium]|jgi:L-threonylcarbamoyladenylate synthase|nr:L-threonylcarbamoyladenylate synthase [Candidatus Peribacteraceae bacterium]MDP7454820.1 L-threonylcarbamoyladenylate synthase [Candidatus Peribacteraceae bacterium]MDP7645904.1 L-threonylcarbamoyladenylate synthase [Candidatus Peribacteraceae bacterium]|tara:strand:- start:367 stop:960 length:594 start_codon:yes stop_codon:yes gene_type:complete
MQTLEASEASIAFAIEILNLGGVVAHATETCYGLACDMTNSEAVEKLFNIKNRPDDQPVSALFPSIKASSIWVEWTEKALALAKKEFPGPLTIILPIKPNKTIYPIPKTEPENRNPTLGIRISPHPIALELAKQFSKPLSTTSANLTGQPSAYSVEEIEKQLADNPPDLVIDSGMLEKKSPSKVVMFIDGEVTVIRN